MLSYTPTRGAAYIQLREAAQREKINPAGPPALAAG